MRGMSEERHYREIDLPVYREELAPYLPKRIFDTHVHLLRRADYLPGVVPEKLKTSAPAPLSKDFTYRHLSDAMARLFPRQQWEAIVFHQPFRYVDIERANRWIASLARKHSNLYPLMMPTPEMKPGYVESEIEEQGFLGLKPYQGLGTQPKSGEPRVRNFLTAPHMKIVNERGLIVVLHVPRKGRIADPVNIRDVAELCHTYPNARIVLAHTGRSYGPYFIEQAIPTLKGCPNLWFDLAALDETESIEVLLDNVSHERILFASDLPVTLLHGRHLCVNRHCFFLTEEECPNAIRPPKELEFAMTYMLYETCRALIRAWKKKGLPRKALNDMFYGNAKRLVNIDGRS